MPIKVMPRVLALAPLAFLAASFSLAVLGPCSAQAAEDPPEQIDTDKADTDKLESLAGSNATVHDLLRVSAGPLALYPVVLVQVQTLPYVGDDSFLQAGDPAERPGFRLRRARLGFEGRLYNRMSFRLAAEFNSDERGTARLQNAWFGYDRYRPLQLFGGIATIPFSRSAQLDAGGSALIERPLAVRAMAPFNQLGLFAQGTLFAGTLSYAAGVYNGFQRSDQFYEGYGENSALLGNRFDGVSLAGRISSEPFGPLGRTIEDLHKKKFRLGVGASFFYSHGGTRDILGTAGDILLHSHGFHLLGEFLTNRAMPEVTPTQATTQISTVQSIAVVAEAGYMILKERLGASARFEWINPNTSVKDESDSWLLTGGLSYHVLHDFLRAQLNYTHRQEIFGKPLKNDSLALQFQIYL